MRIKRQIEVPALDPSGILRVGVGLDGVWSRDALFAQSGRRQHRTVVEFHTVGYQRPRVMGLIAFHCPPSGSKINASGIPSKPCPAGCIWPLTMLTSYLLVPPATSRRPSGRNVWPQQKRSTTVPFGLRKVA